eukprot:Selendium_serpulae@DN6514_c4_g1_i1.p1
MASPDGEKHLANAEKALKKSFTSFRFSPDHTLAALEYRQAATAFQRAAQYDRAVAALHKCAASREQLYEYYEAGRCHEEVAMICAREGAKSSAMLAELEKATSFFERAGKADVAVRVMSRIAETRIEAGEVPAGLAVYERCVAVLQTDVADKSYQVSDLYKQMIRAGVSAGLHEQCLVYLAAHTAVLLKVGQTAAVHKNHMAAVVLQLLRRDVGAADRVATDAAANDPKWFGSKEFAACASAIDAYRDGDAKEFAAVMAKQIWTFLPTELAKVAKSLPPPPLGAAHIDQLDPPPVAAPSSGAEGAAATHDADSWMM